ncbi:MAG: hypothetical protein WCJ18_06220 [Planctomycetota bacterium]
MNQLPTPDDLPAPAPATPAETTGRRRPPRNYLSRTEHRRLFWTFMPPAIVVFLTLSWFERDYLRPPAPPARSSRTSTASRP